MLKPNNQEVMKALSPEEATLLSNVQSMIGELLQGGGEVIEEPPAPVEAAVMRSIQKEENMKTTEELDEAIDDDPKAEKAKKVKKEMVTTPSDSETASDDAETRIDETISETIEENVDEVAKSLANILMGNMKKTAKKREINPIVSTLNQVAEVQKSTQGQINDLSTAFEQLLTGIGITEQMKVSKEAEVVEKKGIVSEDVAGFVQVLKDALGVSKSEPTGMRSEAPVSGAWGSNNDQIRKNLSDPNVMNGLIGNKM